MFRKMLSLFAVIVVSATLVTPSAYASSKEDQVISIAKQYIGTPYKYGGTTPSGFDCSGFMLYVFNKVGISLPRTSLDQSKVGTAVSKSNLQPGDIVYFSNTYKAGVSHSGIYVGDGYFVHAASSGVKKTSINDPYYWGPKYTGARRVIKEEVKETKPEPLPTLPKGEYHDVPNDYWAYDSITYLSKKDIITGYDQSLFKPTNSITRAEVATMLAKAFDLTIKDGKSKALDVPENHWAKGAINASLDAGYFQGYPDNTFRPNEEITRSEIASLFSDAFNLAKVGSATDFKDVPESHWAYNPIQNVSTNGIAAGYTDNTYRPKNNATRSEFSVFLHRAMNR
ncbi:S-layer homology domain-containing protein [Alkalihalobacillus sp. TS-13]|uniref:C40 family peptidase n=1 Tax=Alkalihalobacillus sp. TS-13 TaxID=2842455 RepID=UPI001C879BDC|nr:C40 family peptidase [Alkalihalobacillus sp. TS-13]